MAAGSEVILEQAVHATTVAERLYNVSAARAFEEWCHPDAHHFWHTPGEDWIATASERNVVPGGRDYCRFGPPGEPIHQSDGRFLIVKANCRVVSAGTMFCREAPTSSTLCTVEFIPTPSGGVRLVLTDQSVYFDGLHDPSGREQGWQIILERFAQAVA